MDADSHVQGTGGNAAAGMQHMHTAHPGAADADGFGTAAQDPGSMF